MLALICGILVCSQTEKDYKNVVDRFESICNIVFDAEKVNSIEIQEIKSSTKGKFSDFSKLEQETFIILFSQDLSVQLTKLQNKLQDSSDPKIKEISTKLLQLRKKFASQFEDYLVKMLKTHSAEMAESESKNILRRVKSFHDKQNLLVRKRE